MSPRLLSKPATEHACRIGYQIVEVTQAEAAAQNAKGSYLPHFAGRFIVDDLELRDLPAGSVVACDECGRVWVKEYVGLLVGDRTIEMQDNKWRPEKRRERRKRERSEPAA